MKGKEREEEIFSPLGHCPHTQMPAASGQAEAGVWISHMGHRASKCLSCHLLPLGAHYQEPEVEPRHSTWGSGIQSGILFTVPKICLSFIFLDICQDWLKALDFT